MVNEVQADLAARLEEAFALTRLLSNDVVLAAKIPTSVPSEIQFSRRMVIRNFFASVEGTVYAFKQLYLRIAHVNQIDLSTAETAMLNDELYRVDDRGNTKTKTATIRTADNVLFMLRMLSRSTGSEEIKIDFSGAGWQAFQRSIKVRNRITHPRNSGEMELSGPEIDDLVEAGNWFREIVLKIGDVFRDLPPLQFDTNATQPQENA